MTIAASTAELERLDPGLGRERMGSGSRTRQAINRSARGEAGADWPVASMDVGALETVDALWPH